MLLRGAAEGQPEQDFSFAAHALAALLKWPPSERSSLGHLLVTLEELA
jgi:hypothetical protein